MKLKIPEFIIHETETSLIITFITTLFRHFTIIYKMNCFIYVISTVTCKRNLYVFIESEVNFDCSFYNMQLQIFGCT
jgi:hypothetical protein